MTTEAEVKPYPEVGQVFELELDADDPNNTPAGIMKVFGYSCLEQRWEFKGTHLTGKLKRRFKLVRVGSRPNLDVLRARLDAERGSIPQGQWMAAFRDAFPHTDGKGPVGVADASWIQRGKAYFPCLIRDGLPYLFWITEGFDGNWRWLVFADEEEEATPGGEQD